jgi:hypothetical protein
MFLHVVNANYISDYILQLEFNNGDRLYVNLEDELYGEVFEPLKELEFFKRFVISHNSIEWSNGADFAPEFLYKIGKKELN